MDFVRPYSFDRPLFFATLILLTLGVVMVFGTSGILASEKFHQPFHYMVQQAIGAAVGLALVIGLLPLRRPLYENTYVVNGLLILTVALLVLCFAMPTVAKSNRWVILGNIRFQPSELAKISLVLYVAWFIDRTRERIRDPRLVLIPLGITGLVTVLVLREPDFGTGVFIFGLGLAVLFLGGMRFKHLAGLVLIVPPALTAYLLAAPYRVDRVRAILWPGQSSGDALFQVTQSKLAIGSGGLLGVSFGWSTQKLYFLPCAHTDFIFSIIGEEFGLLGTSIALALFIVIVGRGLVISLRASSLQSQLVAAGLTLFLGGQALLNMSVVLGLGPCKGVPLPLVSFGRSSLLASLLAVGILLHISQRKRNSRTKP